VDCISKNSLNFDNYDTEFLVDEHRTIQYSVNKNASSHFIQSRGQKSALQVPSWNIIDKEKKKIERKIYYLTHFVGELRSKERGCVQVLSGRQNKV
jgi:hypothetical protein